MSAIVKDSTRFSIDAIRNLEAEGFSQIQYHSDAIKQIAPELESVSIAMQSHLAIRSIDSQQSLTAAAIRLRTVLNGGGSTDV